jgi:hypothetical protein
MTPTEAADESARRSTRKKWRRPELRKLPIAATATSKSTGNEGSGNPKSGDAHNIS